MIAIRKNDAPVGVHEAGMEIRSIEAGSMYVGFERWPSGRVESLFDGLPGRMCQAEHWGYTLKGKWRVRTSQGDHLVEAGQAYHLPRGHMLLEVLEPIEVVEFTPVNDPYVDQTIKAFERNLPKVLAGLRAAP